MCMPDWTYKPDKGFKALGNRVSGWADDAGRSIHKTTNNILGRTNQGEAQWRAENAAHADALNAESAQAAEAAGQAKEATPLDTDEAAALTLARKRSGIQSTQLNKHLG